MCICICTWSFYTISSIMETELSSSSSWILSWIRHFFSFAIISIGIISRTDIIYAIICSSWMCFTCTTMSSNHSRTRIRRWWSKYTTSSSFTTSSCWTYFTIMTFWMIVLTGSFISWAYNISACSIFTYSTIRLSCTSRFMICTSL